MSGRPRNQARAAVPQTTYIDGVGHFSDPVAKDGPLGRRTRPMLNHYFANHAAYAGTDSVSSAIQNRLLVQEPRGLRLRHGVDRQAHREQSQQEQEHDLMTGSSIEFKLVAR